MGTDTGIRGYATAAEVAAAAYDRDPDFIIPMLQDLQRDLGHLPREAMSSMAKLLEVPLSQLYSVATFYSTFSLTPRGKHLITVCLGTVCYLKGAREIAARIQGRLQVDAGGTTADRLFTFQPVNCLGACALAPVVVIDDEYFTKVKPGQVEDILAKYTAEEAALRHGE